MFARLPTLPIAVKIPLLVVAFSVIATNITGVSSYFSSSQYLAEAAMRNMEAVVGSRKAEMEFYLKSIEEDLTVVADSAMTRDALAEFNTSYGSTGAAEHAALRDAYIFNNPHPLGEKHKLDAAGDGSAYSKTHAQFHPWFRNLLEARGYYDIFLIEPNGDLVYSVFKENDFATNLLTGEWRNTDLANVFRQVRDKAAVGSIAFTDFAAYTPSNGAPASFIATPVMNGDGTFKGALVFQMPIDRINTIMGNGAGLGRTGETYLVGSDMLMRSDSRFRKQGDPTSILSLKVDTETARDALAGKTGVTDTIDYRGELVLSSYTPLTFNGVTWALVADIDEQEVQEPTVALRNWILLLGACIVVVTGLVGFLFARGVSGPISRMNGTMLHLAGGDLTVDVPYQGRRDEIGDMASAVQTFKDNALEVKRLESQQAELEARAAEEARAAPRKARIGVRGGRRRHRQQRVLCSNRNAGLRPDPLRRPPKRTRQARQRLGRGRRSLHKCAGRLRCRGRAVELDLRDQPSGERFPGDLRSRSPECRGDEPAGLGPDHRRRQDRRCRQADQRYFQPDQPAGAERHNRGRAGR
jgi:methyl-accepting chemotaxis protein